MTWFYIYFVCFIDSLGRLLKVEGIKSGYTEHVYTEFCNAKTGVTMQDGPTYQGDQGAVKSGKVEIFPKLNIYVVVNCHPL